MRRSASPRMAYLTCLTLAVLALPLRAADGGLPKPKGGPGEFKYLQYRSIGPAAGGRVSRAAGVPGDPLVYYAAASAGGVWKSSDGGRNWKPIFDDQPASSIGCLAVAPSDPNVVYVGSGEANIRGNVAAGNGIYKSTDAGKTWKHVWKQEGQIGQLIVHPTNPDVAYAAVLGHAFGPNPERGVYRTKDGGATWKQVLAKDENTGAIAVCFDPSNPHVLFAGLWQARRYPWKFESGGPGSGLYVSRDGGDTWKRLGGHGVKEEELNGLPPGIWGRTAVAVAPSDGRRVYALIEAEKGGLYRSDDGGESWKLVNARHYLRIRPWYFTQVTVDPKNADVLWCPSLRLLKSIDGGRSFRQVKGPHHEDHHDLWIDPKDPRRIIDSNDGGVDLSDNGSETWVAPPLPISQFYHVAADNAVPYRVSGAVQDIGTCCGPSNSLSAGNIGLYEWYNVGGGEAGFTAPDPKDPDVLYAGQYGGYLSRFDLRTRQARNVSIYPTNPSGHGAKDLAYRFQWTAPILVSRHDHRVVYHAANVLFRSSDGGQHWQRVSPDLTTNDKAKQRPSGGRITGDNTGVETYCTIFAIAESPRDKRVLWAGSDDGLVQVTRDGGKNWTNVTQNVPGLRAWATVRCLEASPFEAGTAYLVADRHRLDDTRPYLWRTEDYGKTWEALTAKLPQDVYLHVVRADPKRRGLLYLGTERGVSFSLDDGATWRRLKLNLPTVAVHDLVVKDNDLVVGTMGRSIWILDDLTPVREYTPAVGNKDVHLFPAPPAIRWRFHAPVTSQTQRDAGANPPTGALVHYYLKKKPKGDITLEVRDADGNFVQKLTSKEEPKVPEDDPDAPSFPYYKPQLPKQEGVNRAFWDLRYAGAERITEAKIDAGQPQEGPFVLPGTYKLKLTVGTETLTTTVTVKQDPRVKAPAEDLAKQLRMALEVRDEITRLSRLVGGIHALQKQLAARNELLKERSDAKPLLRRARGLLEKLNALDAKLHNPKAEVVYDILSQPGGAQLYSKYGPLFDWIKDADGLPTQGMYEVRAQHLKELRQYEAEFQALLAEDLNRLNEESRERKVPAVVVPAGLDKAAKP